MNDSILTFVILSAIINVTALIVFFVMASNVAKLRRSVAPDPIQKGIVLLALNQKERIIDEIARAISTPETRAWYLFNNVINAKTQEDYQTAIDKFNDYFKNFFALAGIAPDFSKVSTFLLEQKK